MMRNMIVPCVVSGIFGATFAVACGVVDGVGSKEANAENPPAAEDTASDTTEPPNVPETTLTKTVYAGDCSNPEFVYNEDWSNYTAWEYFDAEIPPTASYTAWFYSYGAWSTQHINSMGIQCAVVSSPEQYVPSYEAWKVVVIQ